MTRLQTMQAKDQVPDLPALGAAGHLAGYLFDCGPVAHASMGAAPLGWQEIQAWERVTGIELQTWEARGLRRLSIEYLVSSQAAQDPNCPPPWTDQPTPQQRDRISHALRNIFGSLKGH